MWAFQFGFMQVRGGFLNTGDFSASPLINKSFKSSATSPSCLSSSDTPSSMTSASRDKNQEEEDKDLTVRLMKEEAWIFFSLLFLFRQFTPFSVQQFASSPHCSLIFRHSVRSSIELEKTSLSIVINNSLIICFQCLFSLKNQEEDKEENNEEEVCHILFLCNPSFNPDFCALPNPGFCSIPQSLLSLNH